MKIPTGAFLQVLCEHAWKPKKEKMKSAWEIFRLTLHETLKRLQNTEMRSAKSFIRSVHRFKTAKKIRNKFHLRNHPANPEVGHAAAVAACYLGDHANTGVCAVDTVPLTASKNQEKRNT
jgi:hypothetical protein